MNPPGTRPLRTDERETAADTLAAAFDDDPWFRWALPDDRARRAWVRWFHAVSLDRSLREGTAFTHAEGSAHGAVSVMPPGVAGPDTLGWIRAIRHPPRSLPSLRFLHTGLRTQSRLDAAHPREPVVYVHVLGVHPSRKGTGLGGALLREAFAMAEARRVRVFLETGNPVNLGFYRRFGLEVTGEIRVGDAPPLWTLMSAPQAPSP